MDSNILTSTPTGKFREMGERSRLVELSSSENSVSIEASHSEDEIQVPLVFLPRIGHTHIRLALTLRFLVTFCCSQCKSLEPFWDRD
jgi:hypothetical protein